jgi:hypothetical protein
VHADGSRVEIDEDTVGLRHTKSDADAPELSTARRRTLMRARASIVDTRGLGVDDGAQKVAKPSRAQASVRPRVTSLSSRGAEQGRFFFKAPFSFQGSILFLERYRQASKRWVRSKQGGLVGAASQHAVIGCTV